MVIKSHYPYNGRNTGGLWENGGTEKQAGQYFLPLPQMLSCKHGKISAYSADNIQVTNGDNLLLARKKYSDFIKTYLRYVKNGGIVSL